MTSHCSESDTMYDQNVSLEQHETACDLVKEIAIRDEDNDILWLDIACGKGQILTTLLSECSQSILSRIIYCAFDECKNYVKETKINASSIGIGDHCIEICTISEFIKSFAQQDRRNECNNISISTAINMLHEISPKIIPDLIMCILDQLKFGGLLFLYDNEELLEPEDNAITFRLKEIEDIFNIIEEVAISSSSYEEEPGFPSWGVVAYNQTWSCRDTLKERRRLLKEDMNNKIRELLYVKLGERIAFLQQKEELNPQNQAEMDARNNCLYHVDCLKQMLEG